MASLRAPASTDGPVTAIWLITLLTPVSRWTARWASYRCAQVSTMPASVTTPPETVEFTRSSGTSTSHSSAWRTARARSPSVRTHGLGICTFMSSTTSSTPKTRCAAFTAARRFAYTFTVPVSVTIPECTCTPTSVSSTAVSHFSSLSTSLLIRESDFVAVATVIAVLPAGGRAVTSSHCLALRSNSIAGMQPALNEESSLIAGASRGRPRPGRPAAPAGAFQGNLLASTWPCAGTTSRSAAVQRPRSAAKEAQ